MRVKFSRAKAYVPDFNGNKALPAEEQLQYKMKPMELGDFTDAFDAIRAIGVKPDDKVQKLGIEKQKSFLMLASEIVPKYVESTGAPLQGDDDEPVSMKEACSLGPFMSLVGELFWTLILHSQPTEIDLKN